MEIVEMDGFTVIGLPVRAGWRELWTEMPAAWKRFLSRHGEVDHRQGDSFVDVSLEKLEDQYLQLVGTRVSKVGRVPDAMRAFEIPAQPYIHHRHAGPAAAIADSFGAMYAWAREHGHAAGDFKVDIGYSVSGDELEHELYVGLLPARPWREIDATGELPAARFSEPG